MVQIESDSSINHNYAQKFQETAKEILLEFEELDILGLRLIKLVPEQSLPSYSLARPIGKEEIQISDAVFAEKHEDCIQLLRSCLYHELLHIYLNNKLPNLHKIALVTPTDTDIPFPNWTIVCWIEFLVEYFNKEASRTWQDDWVLSFYNHKWNFGTSFEMPFFIKAVAKYFAIIKTRGNHTVLESVENIHDKKVRDFVLNICISTDKIFAENGYLFDDYINLISLQDCIINAHGLLTR